MDRFKQVTKNLRKDRQKTELNTRRIQSNFPNIERKLDTLAGDDSYLLEFPLSGHRHHATITLRVRPDNCCDCDPGAQTVKRDAITSFHDPSGITNDGIARPIIYDEPLNQTGTTFHYGYNSPFFTPFYHEFVPIGGYSLNPEGGIVIPVNGMYAVLFKNIFEMTTSPDTYVTVSIRESLIDQPISEAEVLSQRIYSVAKGNLPLVQLGALSKQILQYAFCTPLHRGATVSVWIQSNAPFIYLEPGYWGGGPRIDRDSLRVTLMGLGYGILIGKVYDQNTGLPIEGATVSFTMGFSGSTTTDENGMYIFEDLTPGPYSITASKSGYTSMTRDVEVVFNEVASLDFNLS